MTLKVLFFWPIKIMQQYYKEFSLKLMSLHVVELKLQVLLVQYSTIRMTRKCSKTLINFDLKPKESYLTFLIQTTHDLALIVMLQQFLFNIEQNSLNSLNLFAIGRRNVL